ncbi:MAG: nickel/cobalt transporter [Pseudomonadota bacterium]
MHLRQLVLGFALLAIAGFASEAAAQVSLFRPEGIAPEAPTSGFATWIAAFQSEFYRRLVDALSAFRENPQAGWWLILASSLYGMFHAAGPGHGKVVLSSYMLASHAQIRRGIGLSLASSLIQGASAFLLVGVLVVIFNATSGSISSHVWTLERISFAAMALLGIWLVWKKVVQPMLAPKPFLIAEAGHVHPHAHGHDHHDHVHDDSCGCGHAHVPAAEQLAKPLSWREATAICLSIGLRPCTGAVVVLVFALSQSMPWAGAASILAMSVGTAITVSTIVALTVGGRSALLARFDGESLASYRIHRGFEIVGSCLVLVFGIVFLIGSFGLRPDLL